MPNRQRETRSLSNRFDALSSAVSIQVRTEWATTVSHRTCFCQKLTPADVPTLISLVTDEHLHVGVQFALASQCEAAIIPVREAVVDHKMIFLDAEDVMRLIEDFAVCTPQTRQRASAMRSEIHSLGEAEQTRLEQEAKEKAAEDARIQRNALKMTDPTQAKELTRQEREEVYRRSLKAMGLKEDGPLRAHRKT